MVTLNFAYTAPVNPEGVSPALTSEQIWTGLQRKVRHAEEFVSVITSCDVLSEEVVDSGLKVTREATFKPGTRPEKEGGAPLREVCLQYAPNRVDFWQPDGSVFSNIVSTGPDGGLLLTYSFEFRFPDADESQRASLMEKFFPVS